MEAEAVALVIRANITAICLALAVLAVEIIRLDEERSRQRRRFWMKSILRRRNEEGTFHLLIPQLLTHDEQYQNFLRMDRDAFKTLLSLVEPFITKKNTKCRRALGASEKLALTLRYLATGM